MHGEAGQLLASRICPLGFLARELLSELPQLMQVSPPRERYRVNTG
jgi:hypothetical protein